MRKELGLYANLRPIKLFDELLGASSIKPEILKGADILVYPTAIGGEPTAPGFDSQPMWQKVMVAQGIMSNTFIIAVNRIGIEDDLEFYGSSFISNPMGEILVQAPRNESAVLVAELDFNQRELWGRLFPFARQREPGTYDELIKPRR